MQSAVLTRRALRSDPSYARRLRQAPGKPDGTKADPSAYIFSLRFLFMVAVGLLAALGALNEIWESDPAAGVDVFKNLLPLCGGVAGATLAAKSLAGIPGAPSDRERQGGVAGRAP